MHRASAIINQLGVEPTIANEEVDQPSGLIYTLDGYADKLMTMDQRLQYERDGYVMIKGLFKPEELQMFDDRFEQICEKKAKWGNMTVMRDVNLKIDKKKGVHNITKIQDWQDDPVLRKFIRHKKLVEYAKAFVGPNVKSIHTMVINKPPDLGKGSSRHPVHQDLAYFPFRPANRIVAIWTAMQKINHFNGGLAVFPGTHKNRPGGELLNHRYPNWEGGYNKAYFEIDDDSLSLQMNELVYPEFEVGDTILFHPLVIHGSSRNKSNGFRRSISCHYASANCRYIEDITGTGHETVALEVEAMAAKMVKRYPAALQKQLGRVTFQQTWRLKSRMIAGKAGTL